MTWSVLVVAALVWSGAGGALADDSDGNWWYEQQQVAQAQAEGITGEGVPVAVIDRAIRPDQPVLADANLTVHEPSFCQRKKWSHEQQAYLDDKTPIPAAYDMRTIGTWHGSNAVAFIVGNGRGAHGRASVRGIAPGADVRFYAVGEVLGLSPADECWANPGLAVARAIVQAVDDGARIITLGYPVTKDRQVSQAVAYALHEEVVVVVPTTDSWLRRLNGVVVVRAVDQNGWGGYGGPRVTVGAPGFDILVQGGSGVLPDGESYIWSMEETPAALVAGMLADVAQKWPQATSNQLIQTLVRNAAPPGGVDEGRDGNDYDDYDSGYGVADLPAMLREDPTRYPDRNPLVVPDDGVQHGLTDDDIRDAVRPDWADPAPSPAPAAQSAQTPRSPRWVWLAVGATVAVVGAVVGVRSRSGRCSRQDEVSITQEGE